MLVGAPDAGILAVPIETLQMRIAAGTATFLVKMKAYRREPANEGADILADKAISDSESRRRVVPMDESSSLHVEKTVSRGRESILSSSSLDIS